MGRELCRMSKKRKWIQGIICAKVLLACREFLTTSPDVVWKLLYFKNKLLFSHSLCTDTWRFRGKRSRCDKGIREPGSKIFSRRKRRRWPTHSFWMWPIYINQKLRKVDPTPDLEQNNLLLVYIRRMNLDSFWSRAWSDVLQNKWLIKSSINLSETVGL